MSMSMSILVLNRCLFRRTPTHPPCSQQQGLPPSMADYGFRLMSSGGRDLLDPASQRSALEELTRFRHRRAEAAAGAAAGGEEPGPSSRSARAAAGDAAAAFGMPPSAAGTYGGVRQRGSAQSGFGIAEGDPWFSLRPSQPSRQPAGMGMPGGRMVMSGGRMVRTDSLGRRCVVGVVGVWVLCVRCAGLRCCVLNYRAHFPWPRLAVDRAGRECWGEGSVEGSCAFNRASVRRLYSPAGPVRRVGRGGSRNSPV